MEVSRWRTEPFRLFFPLGVVLAWVGVGHWILYATTISATYSCQLHGMIQVQGFLLAFAFGFLWTALPRRTSSAPPSSGEMGLAVVGLVLTTAGAVLERWWLAEGAYAGLIVLLLVFAIRRFLASGAQRRPPANFVLIPLGALHGLLGAALMLAATTPAGPAWMMGLGRLMVEQGVFLCFAIGVGGLVLPLIGGAPPPADLGSAPREGWKALAYAAAGVAIFATLAAERAGFERAAPLVRAAIVALGLGLGGGAWRGPAKPGLHRRLVWIAVWCMPVGLAASGVWPDYRVPALHVLFIGGFGLLAFAIATHVAFAHLGLERLALGRPPAIAAVGIAFGVALFARVAADASDTYFTHLGWAAAVWIVGSAIWVAFLAPRLFRR